LILALAIAGVFSMFDFKKNFARATFDRTLTIISFFWKEERQEV
jgi:hypothetical protein